MAAYMNRTISMITGNGGDADADADKLTAHNDNNSSTNADKTRHVMDGCTRIIRAINGDKSPLQIFVKAKRKINDIYAEIEEYVHETTNFIRCLYSDDDIVDKAEFELFESYALKVAGIREVLARDHMKVAFFGRTSNGKSTVINAMLREKILPSGIGHTTNCFCQVEGSDSSEAYLIKEGSDEKLNVTNIKQLANALCQEKLSESSLVRIFWPRERCSLLRDDVVFVDSPGVDVSANLDDWIDNHCLNADVFVLVLNAESTMTRAEKQFFHTVSQKLSKPNIFILNNRWDASANEPEFQESVKFQHTERCIDFLTKELKITNEKEAQERVFFVSAREALQARIEESKGNPPNHGAIAEGFQVRYFEFQDFERKFEECISKSAVQTKFEKHSTRGKTLSNDMGKMLEDILERTTKFRTMKLLQKNSLTGRLQDIEREMINVTAEMKTKIHNMVDEVEMKVSKALNEEIWRLGVLIDGFSMSFHPEPLVLNIYKKELNAHVESGLGSNLNSKLSSALSMNVEAAQHDMAKKIENCIQNSKANGSYDGNSSAVNTESDLHSIPVNIESPHSCRMQALLPTERMLNETKIMVRQQPFQMLYSLNFQNLCADFHEDLQFKFSWGITAMMQGFIGKMKTHKQQITSPDSTHSGDDNLEHSSGVFTQEHLTLVSRFAFSSVGSQGTVGGLLLAGVMLKTIGWRVLLGVGTLYGCVYLYERLSWTNSAKERAFKAQYVNHATKKLKMIVDLTSSNCSHQVQQELSSTFARLCRSVDDATTDMNKELDVLEGQLKTLESNQNQLKLLRNKGQYIHNELEIFEENYIKSN